MIQVDTSELKTIALRNLNKIPATRGDGFRAFLHVILIWLAEWAGDKARRTDIRTGYCAFVLAPDLVGGDGPGQSEKTFHFKEDTTPLLGGNVYLTDYALNRVWKYPAECRDLNGVISILTKGGFADLPFVAFDVDAQSVYIFAEGAATLSLRFPLRTGAPRPFTIDVFMEMVQEIYRQSLQYPEGYPPIWHNREGHVPCRETELIIQGHVACILKARAQGNKSLTDESEWLTIAEAKNNAGRVDIAVYDRNACVVVSELKVLRHCHFPCPDKRQKRLAAASNAKERKAAMTPQPVGASTNEKWAFRGARQAARYKEAEGSPSAALLLFDMRVEDEDLPAVRARCMQDDIRYARYFLHNRLPDRE